MKKIMMTLMTSFALTAFMASCVGETELPPYSSPWVDPEGAGTVESPFNCSAAVNKCQEIGQTASTEWYFVTGYVVGGSGIEPGYGNATFELSDTPEGVAVFTAYHIRNYDYKKFVDGEEENVKVGDKITIYAPLVNFKGNTPETNGGFLYALNDEVGGTAIEPVDDTKYPPVPEGDGTAEKPYNIEQIVKVCEETGQTATTESYYITGYVTFGGDGIDTNYGNASFMLSDHRYGPGLFTAYRIYDVNGAKFTDAEKVKIGDRITVYGKVVNYRGNTPETTQGGKLVSVDSFSSNQQ